MKHSYKNKGKQNLRLRKKLVWIAGVSTGIFILSMSWMVYLNLREVEKTKAAGNEKESGGSALNISGEILCEFTWEKDPITLATLGPDASRSNKNAISAPGGRASTRGLGSNINDKSVDLELEGTDLFNQEGIDIGIDYRTTGNEGYFFSRGQSLQFGIDKKQLFISYRTENGKGSYVQVKEYTGYEIPNDPLYRNYRFIYNPRTGKGEVFVNSVMIWNHQGTPNQPMYWKNAGAIVIGKNMKSDGSEKAFLDNLVIRSTGSTSIYAESLLNFILEPRDQTVKIYWSSSMNEKISHYTIERSINGLDYVPVTTVKSNPQMEGEQSYVYADKSSGGQNLVYYRIKQVFQNGKFVTHPSSAVRFKTEKGFVIDNISPLPFNKAFDLSYYIPQPGRVWIQLINNQGKIVSNETFEAPQGKNVHVFRDEQDLQTGEYTLNVIYDNKKLSKKVVKG